MKRRSIWFKFL